MATRTVEDQPDLTIPEDTIVRGRLAEIKDRKIEWKDKQTGEAREATLAEWWWDILDERYPNRRVKGSCDSKVTNHPNNRFRQWAEALLNRELDANNVFDDEDLIGLQADLSIKHVASKKDDRIFEEVDEVIPVSTTSGGDNVPF